MLAEVTEIARKPRIPMLCRIVVFGQIQILHPLECAGLIQGDARSVRHEDYQATHCRYENHYERNQESTCNAHMSVPPILSRLCAFREQIVYASPCLSEGAGWSISFAKNSINVALARNLLTNGLCLLIEKTKSGEMITCEVRFERGDVVVINILRSAGEFFGKDMHLENPMPALL